VSTMSHDTLLSIDPGKDHCAWAWWEDGGLVECGRTGSGWSRADGVGRRARRTIIELPQVYQQRRWRGDPNDLIQVALTVGALEYQAQGDVVLVRPHQWKGSMPKDVMGRRIQGRLSEVERACVALCGVPASRRHDVVDAVGIGLWGLGRL